MYQARSEPKEDKMPIDMGLKSRHRPSFYKSLFFELYPIKEESNVIHASTTHAA